MWLFSGEANGSTLYNDMWKFDTIENRWYWIAGQYNQTTRTELVPLFVILILAQLVCLREEQQGDVRVTTLISGYMVVYLLSQ